MEVDYYNLWRFLQAYLLRQSVEFAQMLVFSFRDNSQIVFALARGPSTTHTSTCLHFTSCAAASAGAWHSAGQPSKANAGADPKPSEQNCY
jgi:hypothetical protein